MKQLSSHLSKPRRRIYSLLLVGGLVAFVAAAVGALIVALGYSSPDVTLPFWECGQYILLLSLLNLGVYVAIFWQLGRLTRREGRGAAAPPPPAAPARVDLPPPAAPARERPPANPVKISRQVRGTVASLNLDP